jgi:hypothetical protein
MGFKTWRNWSVFLLTGAALAGCNNTPTRDNTIMRSGDQPMGLNQQKGPFNSNGQQVGTSKDFPRADNLNTQIQGQNRPDLNSPFNQNNRPAVDGNSPFNQNNQQLQVGGNPPNFPKMGDSNVQPPPNPFNQPNNSPFSQQAPTTRPQFGDGRITQPNIPQPDVVQPPSNFPR